MNELSHTIEYTFEEVRAACLEHMEECSFEWHIKKGDGLVGAVEEAAMTHFMAIPERVGTDEGLKILQKYIATVNAFNSCILTHDWEGRNEYD